MPEIVLPGTYIEVRDEGLISAGRISTGNIGIVGTALQGPIHTPQLISSLSEAREVFGEGARGVTLVRSLELIYQNGGRTVYAVSTGKFSQYTLTKADSPALTLRAQQPGKAGNTITVTVTTGEGNAQKDVEIKQVEKTERYTVSSLADLAHAINQQSTLVEAIELDPKQQQDPPNNVANATLKEGEEPDYRKGLEMLEEDIINIVVLAGQDTSHSAGLTALTGHLATTAGLKRERIGIMGVGFDADGKDRTPEDVPANDRLILVSPGIVIQGQRLSAGYLAAAVAGKISSLPVHTSPTNKTLTLEGLTTTFNSAALAELVQSRVLAVEKRNGFRIVKGITTHDGAWQQVTTRRIVDYAIYGVRSSCNPYIGKLNNVRVRGAMKATLDSFLTRMVENEALVSYGLEVSATRAQEIAGEAIVTMTLAPTFSIDFVKVTMYLG